MEREILETTANALKEEVSTTRSVVDFYEKFISDTIRSGEMKNVRIPLFGLFHVNLKRLKKLAHVCSEPKVETREGGET